VEHGSSAMKSPKLSQTNLDLLDGDVDCCSITLKWTCGFDTFHMEIYTIVHVCMIWIPINNLFHITLDIHMCGRGWVPWWIWIPINNLFHITIQMVGYCPLHSYKLKLAYIYAWIMIVLIVTLNDKGNLHTRLGNLNWGMPWKQWLKLTIKHIV
jgi:hypothetical protein